MTLELKHDQRGAERLTPAEIDSLKTLFADQGFVVCRNVVPGDRLEHLRTEIMEEFERVEHDKPDFQGGGRFAGHLNCFTGEASRFIYDSVEAYGIIDLVNAIMPSATRRPYVGGNLNLPGSHPQHYHTDRPFTKEFLIVNTAIVDNNNDNGATEVLPGTHTRFYPYWKFVLNRVARSPFRVQLNAGDVMIRSSNLWHRGMPNRTSIPRPMAALTWEDGGSFAEDPFANNEGRITFFPNWFKPTTLGRLRERVFITVPQLYDAYRIVDSLVTKKGYE
jgi:hypothetical protein